MYTGPTYCNCDQKVGLEIEYKQGLRRFGYTFNKGSVMWRHEDEQEYQAIKKWSAVPFHIQEEHLFPADRG